jgi:glycyl-tRNA synthetase beta chain
MGELLLELLSEEIPARMQRRAIDDLCALVREKLAAAEIPAQTLRFYVTPRRLAVIADGIPERQPDRSEERRGPRVGAPQAALDGFLRAAGLQSIGECETRDTGRGEFHFAILKHKGQAAGEILPELLRAAIAELPWPKSMRYPASTLRWVRPLISVVCLLDGAILPLPLDQIPVGRTTRGHRFLSEGEITVDGAADYLRKLEQAHVMLDQDRRREIIAADLDRLAAAEGLRVKPDPGLLDEVTGLVEFPVVLMGAIDEASMALPPEVLATAMRTHQKYFSCLKPEPAPAEAGGTAAPRFLFVANNRTADHGNTIVAGNERVLRARLADARFFWEQDRKVRLEDRVEALKDRVYHAKLGSVFDKVERVEQLAGFLAGQLHPAVIPAKAGIQDSHSDPGPLGSRVRGNDDAELEKLAQRAARLAKADLSTGMVGEFPELQGVMGRYYALNDGEDPRVAEAIAEHYKPLGPNDTCPTAPVSIAVALADKFDTFASFFRIGERPTGSGDPFAIRRAVLGIIRIVLENEIHLSLSKVLQFAVDPGPPFRYENEIPQTVSDLSHFIGDRLKVHLRGQGVRHDVIDAVLMLGTEDDLIRLLARVDALQKFLDTDDGANLLTAYHRASNIVSIEEGRDKRPYHDADYDPRGGQGEELALRSALDQVAGVARELVRDAKFEGAMSALATLRRPIDEFFEKVTVNTDAEGGRLRENRLRLLSRIRAVMNQVADFSQIEG